VLGYWAFFLGSSAGFWNAMGDDMEKGVALKPGSFFVLPANHIHQTWTTDEEVIHAIGCLALLDVNIKMR
jgi:hypothetical protein